MEFTWFQRFNRDRRRVVPGSLKHFPELSVSDFANQLQTRLRDLPLVLRVVRKTDCLRLLNLKIETDVTHRGNLLLGKKKDCYLFGHELLKLYIKCKIGLL